MNSKFILLILISLFLDGYRLSIADGYANLSYADVLPEEQSLHNECAGIARKIISGYYLYEGGHFCETLESIETRTNVEIGDSADVTFRSKTVSLGALFAVNNNSFFRIQTTGIGLNNELSGIIFVGSMRIRDQRLYHNSLRSRLA